MIPNAHVLRLLISTTDRTGATGYIGGTVLDTLVKEHPEYAITVLLRKTPAGFQERYKEVHVANGQLDDVDLIERVSAESDIIICTSLDLFCLRVHF
jgi:nucleoside-diphosphate-sugar epimerase